MPGSHGTSIRIFLVDGTPEGLRLVERSNWTGQAVVVSKSQYPDVRNRPEFAAAGVYVLVGDDDEKAAPVIYIGEGDDVRLRLDQHVKYKDFWTRVVVFSSKDGSLNKAHIRYLEARLVELAKAADTWILDNNTSPQRPSLTEPEVADVESFLEDMLVIYPLLGVDAFESPPAQNVSSEPLLLSGPAASGRGFDQPEGFVVLAGSRARIEEVPTFPDRTRDLRHLMVEKGVLVEREASYELTKDTTFSSPSQAATFLLGRSANGRTEWKTASGTTLKKLQEDKLGGD